MERILSIAASLLAASLVATGCGDDCTDGVKDMKVQNACTQGTFAPGEAFTLDVETARQEDPCGEIRCTVRRDGGAIFLAVEQDSCAAAGDEACASAIVPCGMPALDPGGYSLRANGAPFGTLQVADGGATSCSLD